MGKYDAAKAAAKARANPALDDELFRDAPGLFLICRGVSGLESAPLLQGTWTEAPVAFVERGSRIFWRALQLWERTRLYLEVSRA